mmetsp:Transcript_41647/g.82182  ORF Transcript_41647/g.82182 Transcript_41647/m.82182 type:complete len:110 (+) Transcript_41647:892-1221(+)
MCLSQLGRRVAWKERKKEMRGAWRKEKPKQAKNAMQSRCTTAREHPMADAAGLSFIKKISFEFRTTSFSLSLTCTSQSKQTEMVTAQERERHARKAVIPSHQQPAKKHA